MNRRQLTAIALIVPIAMLPVLAPAQAKEEKEKEGARSYIALSALAASIVRPSGERGVITVEAGLDIADPALRQRAEASVPRLRASYTEFLQSHVGGLARGAPVNADYLATQLQRRTDQVLGRPGAKFLIGSILMN